ncbi:MAG: energy transducer TonB [Bdellovibrionales bacterium]|nr:energy transducer TonB [Bdellovibrionales bacterium]
MNITLSIFISIMVHTLIVLGVFFLPKDWLDDQVNRSFIVQKATPLEISLLDSKNEQQIVRQAIPPKDQLNKESKEKARFLSSTNQRVLLETKAKLSGQTSNNFSTPKYQQELIAKELMKNPNPIKSKTFQDDLKNSEIEISQGDKHSQYKPLELYPHQKYGVSTLGESLPDNISIGNFTALNTDQFQYYTFYSRIEDLVRFRWESKIREAINQLNRRQVLKNIGKNEWISQVEFLIDKDGYLRKALILRESGITKFDQSAILAFEDAKVFPNPPKEMLRNDGYIHLRYSFHVNYTPVYTAR